MILSNIIDEEKTRDVQKETLDIIAKSLVKSFGPQGSTTAIVKSLDEHDSTINIEYTKDGHSIVKAIRFYGSIERSVQDILTTLTRQIVKEVGDGTTSAIMLSNYLFKELCNNEKIASLTSSEIIKGLNKAVKIVTDYIQSKARPCTLEDIYKIALISTNDNEDEAKALLQIYKEFGLDVYIDVGVSTSTDNIVKAYDGMSIELGYSDPCFVNDKTAGTATINNPRIYCFYDPIDTPEMIGFLDKILMNNIIRAYQPNSMYQPVPTVILCNKISPDASNLLEHIVKMMHQMNNIPLLIVSDIGSTDRELDVFEDIIQMTGARVIRKYTDIAFQELDQQKGNAPTLETITEFCGYADAVVADSLKTKIIRPIEMFNEDGTQSDKYKNMISILEAQLNLAIEQDAGIKAIANARRRLNGFKGNMVDYLVGGVSGADRNNLKAAIEDAVLNCRSAAKYGVGYGANYMALEALEYALVDKYDYYEEQDPMLIEFLTIICDANHELIRTLYEGCFDEGTDIIDVLLDAHEPMNIRTGAFDNSVLSSIRSDIVILETVSKILSLMFTCNQYLLQTFQHANPYK